MTKQLLALNAIIVPLGSCIETPTQPEPKYSIWLDQGWNEKDRKWFHHVSQGTATFLMPYEWFVDLEQPIKTEHWYRGLKRKNQRHKIFVKIRFHPKQKF